MERGPQCYGPIWEAQRFCRYCGYRLLKAQLGIQAAVKAMSSKEIQNVLQSMGQGQGVLKEVEKELNRLRTEVDLKQMRK